VHSFSVSRGRKNYGMTTRAPLTLVIRLESDASPLVWITCLMAKTLGVTLAYCASK
jgi:hypothetical protein